MTGWLAAEGLFYYNHATTLVTHKHTEHMDKRKVNHSAITQVIDVQTMQWPSIYDTLQQILYVNL